LGRLLLLNGPHDVMVVAHQQVTSLVEARRVGEFQVSMGGEQRGDRRIERRGVAQARIKVPRGKRAGYATARAATGERSTPQGLGSAVVFGQQLASRVDLGAGDVAVHVDPAGHYDKSR